jgi:hypothetical protein
VAQLFVIYVFTHDTDVPETFTLKELADASKESLGQAYSAKPRVSKENLAFILHTNRN